jgi:Skp family chaperone for outer membrane proteins
MFRIVSAARLLAAGAALAMVAAGSAGVARAQDTTTKAAAAPATPAIPVIVVLDPDRVVRESSAGKSVAAEADKYGKGFEDESRKEEAALQAAVEEAKKDQANMTREQIDQKRGEFERRAAEVRGNELKRRQAFERSYNAAMSQVQQAMIDATREIALAHRADVVLVRQALMFFNSQYDITGEVIEQVNKKITAVDFPVPKIEAEAPGTAPAAAPAADTAKPKAKSKEKLDKPLQLNLQPQQQQ